MPYDQTLDISSFKETIDFGNTRINIGVWSYNNSAKKVGISRENQVDGNWNFVKLGRFNKNELETIIPIIIKAGELL